MSLVANWNTENILLIVLVVSLGAWWIWDFRMRQNPKSGFSLISQLLALCCIPLTLCPPQIHRNVNAPTSIILTEGFSVDSLTSLQKRLKNSKIYVHQGIYRNLPPKMTGSLDFLEGDFQDSENYILGNGLPEWDLPRMNGIQAKYLANPMPFGIIEMHGPGIVMESEEFVLSGKVHCHNSLKKVLFEGPFGSIPVITNRYPGVEDFKIKIKINAPGRYLLQMNGMDSLGSQIFNERFPIVVKSPNLDRILIIENAPSFEVNYLKHFMTEREIQVALHRRISQDAYIREYVNLPNENLAGISSRLFQRFPIIILDLASIQLMEKNEVKNLVSVIRGGSSVVILSMSEKVPEGNSENQLLKYLSELVDPVNNSYTVTVNSDSLGIDEKFSATLDGVILKKGQIPLVNIPNPGEYTLASKPLGLGRLFIHHLPSSYHMILQGKKKLYAKYWEEILGIIQPFHFQDEIWKIEPEFPILKNSPMKFVLVTNDQSPEGSIKQGESSVSFNFQQSPALAQQWSAPWWPSQSGWHSISTKKGREEFWFYVFDDPHEDWQTMRSWQKIKMNKVFFEEQGSSNSELTSIDLKYPVPRWIFYSLFLIFISTRWILEKIFNN